MSEHKNKNKYIFACNKLSLAAVIFLLLSIVQTVFIFTISLFDRPESLKQSGAVRQTMQNIVDVATKNSSTHYEVTQHFVRKLAHFTEFFILGLLLCSLFILIFYILQNKNNKNANLHFINCLTLKNSRRALIVSLLLSTIIATTDELLQFTSGRAPMIQDVLLDMCGAFSGIVFLLLAVFAIVKLVKHYKSRNNFI